MKTRTALVSVAIAVSLAAMCREAHASRSRVIVAGADGDPVALRLEKELVAMGFEPVRVDDAAHCSRGAISAWIEEMHAAGATCSESAHVSVWVVTRSGLHLADVVTDAQTAKTDDAAPDMLAVRAAEVARASLELSAGEAGDPPPPPSSPPAWSANAAPAVDAALRRPDPKTVDLPRTPSVTFGVGAAAIMGADATGAGFDTELDVRVARFMSLVTRSAIVPSGARVGSVSEPVNVAPNVFATGVLFPLAAQSSFLVPRLGTGVGMIWLRTSAAENGADSFNPSSQQAAVRRTDSIVSPLVYVNAAVSLRIAGPFRLTFDGLVGTTAHRLVVRSAGQEVAYWGQPFGALTARAELAFK